MFRRILTAGLAPTALLAALAWTANATAKPPDLPLVEKDVLAPQTPFAPDDVSHPAQPNPFPIVAAPDAGPLLEMPSLLHMRPSARRMMASCLLFGANPMLALAPTQDYFDIDDDDVQAVTPAAFLAPITSEAPTGSLLRGVGVNTDVGLTGSIDLNGSMAWGEIITACWRMFQPPADQPRSLINAFTPAGFIQGLSSDGNLISDLDIPILPQAPEPIHEAPKELTPNSQEQSACPWMRQLQRTPDRAGVVFTEADFYPDVLHNLTMLHQSQTLLQKARELGGQGRLVEALDCLDLAHDLCPGNRFDAALQEAAVALFAPCYCGSPQGAVGGGGDVLSEPPAEKTKETKPADETKQFNTSRSTGREREIEMKLSQPATVILKDEPLHQVIDDLRAWQNIHIAVDKAALDAEEISLDRPISIKVENVSLKKTLSLILKEAHLTYVVKNDVLQITTERGARGKLICVSYAVADILTDAVAAPETPTGTGKAMAPETLIKLLTSTVRPHEWSDKGGPGTIDFHPLSCTLVVNQTADVQEAVVDLLESLRRQQHPKAEECDETAPCNPFSGEKRGPEQPSADPLVTNLQLAADGPAESDESRPGVPLTPCLPPVDPTTPAALDQLIHESEFDPNAHYERVEGVLDSDEGQEQPADMPRGIAKPFRKAEDLEAVGCGKDAGAPMSCLEVFSAVAAAPQGSGELYLGLDGSIQMFTQFRRRGEIWHIVYKSGGLSVWAAPNGGADAETPADDKPSD